MADDRRQRQPGRTRPDLLDAVLIAAAELGRSSAVGRLRPNWPTQMVLDRHRGELLRVLGTTPDIRSALRTKFRGRLPLLRDVPNEPASEDTVRHDAELRDRIAAALCAEDEQVAAWGTQLAAQSDVRWRTRKGQSGRRRSGEHELPPSGAETGSHNPEAERPEKPPSPRAEKPQPVSVRHRASGDSSRGLAGDLEIVHLRQALRDSASVEESLRRQVADLEREVAAADAAGLAAEPPDRGRNSDMGPSRPTGEPLLRSGLARLGARSMLVVFLAAACLRVVGQTAAVPDTIAQGSFPRVALILFALVVGWPYVSDVKGSHLYAAMGVTLMTGLTIGWLVQVETGRPPSRRAPVYSVITDNDAIFDTLSVEMTETAAPGALGCGRSETAMSVTFDGPDKPTTIAVAIDGISDTIDRPTLRMEPPVGSHANAPVFFALDPTVLHRHWATPDSLSAIGDETMLRLHMHLLAQPNDMVGRGVPGVLVLFTIPPKPGSVASLKLEIRAPRASWRRPYSCWLPVESVEGFRAKDAAAITRAFRSHNRWALATEQVPVKLSGGPTLADRAEGIPASTDGEWHCPKRCPEAIAVESEASRTLVPLALLVAGGLIGLAFQQGWHIYLSRPELAPPGLAGRTVVTVLFAGAAVLSLDDPAHGSGGELYLRLVLGLLTGVAAWRAWLGYRSTDRAPTPSRVSAK